MSDIDKTAVRLRDSIDRRRKLSTVYTADVLALLAAHDLLKLDTGKLGQQVEETAKAAGIQKTDNERLRKALQKVLDVGHPRRLHVLWVQGQSRPSRRPRR